MTNGVDERLAELLRGWTGRGDEKEILALLGSLSASDLNEVLEGLDVMQLFASVDNRLLGPNLYDEMLQLLTVERIGDLSIRAQAKIAAGLQRGRTTGGDEQALLALLTSRHGEELSHLKNAINLAKGRHDLEGLVFSDIGDDAIRDAVLQHFRDEGRRFHLREAKTLSDIDDTAIAKLHENRYPKGTVVPGILALYEALDRGPDDAPRSRGDLTFVTARPSDAMGLTKGQSRRTLTEAGIADLSIMTGSWFNLATHDSMAAKKVENIAHYAQLFPEYDLVFIGDSGQGDVVVAEKIVASHDDVVQACFIHDVVGLDDTERARLAERSIWVVDTYVAAAAKALELGLISPAGLREVVEESRRLLDEIEWDSTEQEQATRALLERDLARTGEL